MSSLAVVEYERYRVQAVHRNQVRIIFAIRLLSVALLCAGPAFSQAKLAVQADPGSAPFVRGSAIAAPAISQAGAHTGTRANAAAEVPVVSLADVCDGAQKTNGTQGCKTVVTRSDVDALISLLEPNASPAARHQFTVNYSRLVAAAGEAERRDLERDPALAQQIEIQQKLVRMQLLANTLYRQIETQANDVPTGDVEKFYAEHQDNFAQGELRRLYVPKTISALSGQSADLAILRAKADDVRARGAAGEDFDSLQLEIFKDLGVKTTAPPSKLGLTSRMKLPLVERPVFDLDPGHVTEVIDTPSAFVVLKLESKNTIPIEVARLEIVPVLQRERERQEIREVSENGKTVFNLKYLDLPSTPDFLPPPQLAGLPPDPGAQSTLAQRVPMRRPSVSRRHEVTVFSPTQR